MTTARPQRGPWTHRLLVHVFTVLFGILVFWLLSFLMRDIATWPGPEYVEIEKRSIDVRLTDEAATIQKQIDEANRATADWQQRQMVLRDSTGNSERTMNQLLELQKLTLQKGLVPSAEETSALVESERLFLANQTRYQEMNAQIATLSEQLSGFRDRQRDVQLRIETLRPAIREEFSRLSARHQFKVAATKLGVLVPILALAAWLFALRRGSLYSPLIYGLGIAVLVKVAEVMHEHFPTRFFKYILIVIAIALVTRALIHLLRATAFPKVDWLLKQYREAYEHFRCPVCSHPIRRGPLKHRFWTNRSLKKLQLPDAAVPSVDEPYVCPVCAIRLFEECGSCKMVRHSLLPACTNCGAEKPVVARPATSAS